MNDQNNYLATNLTYLIRTSGLSATHLAEKLNLSVGLLIKLKSNKAKNTTLRNLTSICNFFNIKIDHLLFTDIAKLGVLPKFMENSYIPLFSIENLSNPNNKFIFVKQELPPDTFAVKISNNSKEFENGSIIFVNRNIKPKSFDYIILLNLNSWLYTLKQLIIEGNLSYLKSTTMEETVKVFNKAEYAYYATVIGYQTTKFYSN